MALRREELKTLTLRLVLQQIVGLSVKLWEGEGLVREVETAFLTDRLWNQWERG